MINEDVNQNQTWYCPLGHTFTGLHVDFVPEDHHPLGSAVQTVFDPTHCLLIQPILQQLLYEDIMGLSLSP